MPEDKPARLLVLLVKRILTVDIVFQYNSRARASGYGIAEALCIGLQVVGSRVV